MANIKKYKVESERLAFTALVDCKQGKGVAEMLVSEGLEDLAKRVTDLFDLGYKSLFIDLRLVIDKNPVVMDVSLTHFQSDAMSPISRLEEYNAGGGKIENLPPCFSELTWAGAGASFSSVKYIVLSISEMRQLIDSVK